jgi:adenine/guanine phosphoribosyltransferase-like PRPP-binding protein
MMEIKTDYLSKVYYPKQFEFTVKESIATARTMLREVGFDSIAFTGYSGSAIAYILSAELSVPLICIRKATDKGHYVRSYGLMEGCMSAKKFIFVDDFISSGETIRNVLSMMSTYQPQAECVGALMNAACRDNYSQSYLLNGANTFTNIKIYTNYSKAYTTQLSIPFWDV